MKAIILASLCGTSFALFPWFAPHSATPCGGDSGIACDVDEYCDLDTCGGSGTCRSRPRICLFGGAHPVCGCDGVTYKSSCAAHNAGVSVAEFSSCSGSPVVETPDPTEIAIPVAPFAPKAPRARDTCIKTNDCASDQFCLHQSCDASSKGKCVDIPAFCPFISSNKPVCGCDGFTYNSVCEATRASVNVQSRGPCPLDPEGPIAPSTPESCMYTTPNCTNPRAVCMPKVGLCPDDFPKGLPVEGTCIVPSEIEYCSRGACGCNGQYYKSDCEAYTYGAPVRNQGMCPLNPIVTAPLGFPPHGKPPARKCDDNGDCDASEYCLLPDGKCGGYGMCSTRGSQCPDLMTSSTASTVVCGCNSQTYQSVCSASFAGVSIVSKGVCEVAPIGTPQDEDGSCDDDTDCGPNEFCNFDTALCGTDSSVLGVCTKVPTKCPKSFSPIVRAGGIIGGAAGGIGGGAAGGGDGGGIVRAVKGDIIKDGGVKIAPKPGKSPQPVSPGGFIWRMEVCGCDNQTYSSVCDAHRNRVSIASKFPCFGNDIILD